MTPSNRFLFFIFEDMCFRVLDISFMFRVCSIAIGGRSSRLWHDQDNIIITAATAPIGSSYLQTIQAVAMWQRSRWLRLGFLLLLLLLLCFFLFDKIRCPLLILYFFFFEKTNTNANCHSGPHRTAIWKIKQTKNER